jgi:hypothetical protein
VSTRGRERVEGRGGYLPDSSSDFVVFGNARQTTGASARSQRERDGAGVSAVVTDFNIDEVDVAVGHFRHAVPSERWRSVGLPPRSGYLVAVAWLKRNAVHGRRHEYAPHIAIGRCVPCE